MMGQNIRIRKRDAGKLWLKFEKTYPEVKDYTCKEVFFKAVFLFNSICWSFPDNSKELKLVLQYVLGDELLYNGQRAALDKTKVKILYAIVTSCKPNPVATDGGEVPLSGFVTTDNGEIFFPERKYCLGDKEIRSLLRKELSPMPQNREDLSKIGEFFRIEIQKTINTIDRFLNMDDEKNEMSEETEAKSVERYLNIQETIRRVSGSNGKQGDDKPKGDKKPEGKSVSFFLDIK